MTNEELKKMQLLNKLTLLVVTEDYSDAVGVIQVREMESWDKALRVVKEFEPDADEGKWAAIGTSLPFPEFFKSSLNSDNAEHGVRIQLIDEHEVLIFEKTYYDYNEFAQDLKKSTQIQYKG